MLLEIEPNVELLSSEYINNRQQLTFKCECGKVFQKNWTTIQQRNQCKCRSCARKAGWKEKRRDKDYFEKVFDEYVSFGYIPLEEIQNKKNKILCKDQQNYKGYINYQNASQGKHFSVFSVVFNKENLLYNLNNFAKINNIKTTVDSFEEGKRSCEAKLYCTCSCGNKFVASLTDFTTQNHCRCERCSKKQSGLEYLSEIEIAKYSTNYLKQKRFKDCINPKTNYPLSFDFYITDINTCIEIDGQQHFYASKFGNETNEEAEENFKKRIALDEIKNTYCKENGIKLVRISYKEFRNKNKTYKQTIKNLFS